MQYSRIRLVPQSWWRDLCKQSFCALFTCPLQCFNLALQLFAESIDGLEGDINQIHVASAKGKITCEQVTISFGFHVIG